MVEAAKKLAGATTFDGRSGAVTTDVEEATQSIVRTAHDQQGFSDRLGGEVVARLGDLIVMRDHLPGAVKNPIFFLGGDIGIEEIVSVAPIAGSVDDPAFNAYEQHFLDEFWKLNPDWATSVGYHKYDSLLLIPNKSTREKQLNFAKVQLDSLGKYNPSGF